MTPMTDTLLTILVNGTTIAIEISFFLFISSARLKIEKLPQKKWKHKLAEWVLFLGFVFWIFLHFFFFRFLNSIWPNSYSLLWNGMTSLLCMLWWLFFRELPFLQKQYDEADGRFVFPDKKYGVKQLLPLKAWIVLGILSVLVILYVSVE
jgi:hypothetical protein